MKVAIIIVSLIFSSCSTGTGKRPQTRQTMTLKKFEDSLNTAVFATKFIILDKKDITIVRHESEDGAWTFFSNDEYENYEEVAKVVALGQIIEIDSTILEIADLPKGYYASRKSKQDKWKVERLKAK